MKLEYGEMTNSGIRISIVIGLGGLCPTVRPSSFELRTHPSGFDFRLYLSKLSDHGV
jgi:hypothetical protein